MKQFLFRSPILEIGCGTGETLIEISKEYDIKGIDLSEEAVTICRAKGLNVEKSDLLAVSGKFNSIICVDVVEHIRDDEAFVKHIYEILNHRGKLFILVPSGKMLQDDINFGHYRRYSRSSITELLRKNNFIIESTEMFGYPFFYYARFFMNFVYRRNLPKDTDLQGRTLKSSCEHPFDNTIPAKMLKMVFKAPVLSKLFLKFLLFQEYFSKGNKGFAVIVIALKP
jgi:SAM-dependent methyltransferase